MASPGALASVVDHHAGDSGFTSLRSHAAFRPEGAKLPEAYATYWRTGTTVLGPCSHRGRSGPTAVPARKGSRPPFA